MSVLGYSNDLHRAFIAGAKWAIENTRVANDGDGRTDVMEPSDEEIQEAANHYWRKP